MQPARPLRDVFDEVARGDLGADPAEALADSGHADLPDQLVSEAIVNYADTAPIEVAEHLAPFVTVHSAVPNDSDAADLPAGQGLDLLATAPEPIVPDGMEVTEPAPEAGEPSYADAIDFGFGSGAEELIVDAQPSIEDVEGVPVEAGPADELPAPAESATDPTYQWIGPPEAEAGVEPGEDDAGPVG
jgi:hypothetical protein